MNIIPVHKIKSNGNCVAPVSEFRILSVMEFVKDENFENGIHGHDFYFILVLEKGKGVHNIDFVNYSIGNGSVFILRPGQVHALRLEKGSTGFLFEFAPGFYSPSNILLKKALLKTSRANRHKMNSTGIVPLLIFCKSMHEEYLHGQEGHLESITANLDLFFIHLFRVYENENTPNQVTSNVQEKLEKFLDLLNENIREEKKVEEYARMLNLSVYQLNRITKIALHKTSSEVIADYILLEAKRNLLGTSNQVKEIAFHLGYFDVSYFTRFFKKQTGESPSVFRQNAR